MRSSIDGSLYPDTDVPATLDSLLRRLNLGQRPVLGDPRQVGLDRQTGAMKIEIATGALLPLSPEPPAPGRGSPARPLSAPGEGNPIVLYQRLP